MSSSGAENRPFRSRSAAAPVALLGHPRARRRDPYRSDNPRPTRKNGAAKAIRTLRAADAAPTDRVIDVIRQTDRRRIVPGLNTLFSKASRHSAEALPLRGSAVQDARHVAISASDDGGAYRRSSGLICSANTRLDGSWTIQHAQGAALRHR